MTLFCLRAGIATDRDKIIDALRDIVLGYDMNYEVAHIMLNGEDIHDKIRTEEIHSHISFIASIPEVRAFVIAQEQEIGKDGKIVMDGRDTAAVVFPDADIKLWVTADAAVRAERRWDEMTPQEQKDTDLTALQASIERRDMLDETE